MIRQTTVKNLRRTASVAGGGETKKGELKENAGAATRETKAKTLPQAIIVAGERDVDAICEGTGRRQSIPLQVCLFKLVLGATHFLEPRQRNAALLISKS